MTTIYMVTTGNYSDYAVLVTFTTKALAEAYASTIVANEVESIELLDHAPASTLRYELVGYVRPEGIGGWPSNSSLPRLASHASPEYYGPVVHEENSQKDYTGRSCFVKVSGPDPTAVRTRFKELVVEAWTSIPHEPSDRGLTKFMESDQP